MINQLISPKLRHLEYYHQKNCLARQKHTSMKKFIRSEYHDHENVLLELLIDGASVKNTTFRVVDGGEDKWEMHFE